VPLRPHGSWLALAATVLAWHGVAGPHLFDTGELVASAFVLGGSHPPGQPLHALLGHAALLLPLGPIEWRITLLSVGGAIVAAWSAGRLAGLLVETWTERRGLLQRLAPDAAALGTLLAPPLLRQAPRPEVYAPALALTLAAFVLLWRWASGGPGGHAALRCAALLAGLVTALHPPHALAIAAVALALFLLARRDLLRRPRAMVGAVAFGVFGLLVHLHLPVRAWAGAPMWGDPTSLSGMVDYITARAYRMNLGAGDHPAEGVVDMVAYAARASGFVPLVGLVALPWAVRRQGAGGPTRGLLAGALIAAPVALLAAGLQPLEESNPDNVAYYGPAVAWLMAAGAAGMAVLPRPGAILGLSLVAIHPMALPQVPSTLRADADGLHTLGALLTHAPPSRALVVVETDFVATTWWAARAVEGARPDVALLATGLSTSSWHWRSLAPHPAFDGNPVRGRGTTPRAAYVDGALHVARATGTPIASEPDAPVGGSGTLRGPYLLHPPDGAVAEGSMAERLAAHLDAHIAHGPEGDHGATGNVLRAHQLARATRLLRRSLDDAAFGSFARALHFVPAPLRARIGAVRGPLRMAPPPAVRTPRAFMVPRADLVHEAARWVFATGAAEDAFALLQWQADGGDPRAILQLGWLHLAGGHPDAAGQALEAFRRHAPQHAAEADPLAHQLTGPATP
jgi:hypothetical protein